MERSRSPGEGQRVRLGVWFSLGMGVPRGQWKLLCLG